MNTQTIYVTRPFMPPLEEFIPYLEQIWESRWLTNNGPFHEKLEQALCNYLGVECLSLFANGTLALVTALQALRISGEVITTPYSFVATAHSLLWNNITPVFVDIDPETMNLDASKIEAAISSKTSAILPVHCYGNPCDVESIQRIADVYGLKVIYDAAHCFGVKLKGRSILEHGDLSVMSFHATKPYTTFEGGAIVCRSNKTKQRIDYLKNFGFADEVTIMAPGINAKMSEIHAAFGLLQLKYIDKNISERNKVDMRYREALYGLSGIQCLSKAPDATPNFSYFPVLVNESYRLTRDELYLKLRQKNVFARRYFYPLLSQLPMYRGLSSATPERLPSATDCAKRILCLPIYPDLSFQDQETVVDCIKETS